MDTNKIEHIWHLWSSGKLALFEARDMLVAEGCDKDTADCILYADQIINTEIKRKQKRKPILSLFLAGFTNNLTRLIIGCAIAILAIILWGFLAVK